MTKPSKKLSLNPIEWLFSLAGMLAKAVTDVFTWATSNFFVVFALGVFVIYVVVFKFFGK